MLDISETTAPKSDQLNADDLIGGQKKTIKITKVSRLGEDQQPVAINFEGDNGKPYKPCKSMRRVLLSIWGKDANQYVGRCMTLYRDDAVKFGGADVGGIRISHMSHIDKPVTMALTASKTNRKPYTVQPLMVDDTKTLSTEAMDAAAHGMIAYESFWKRLTPIQQKALLPNHNDWKKKAAEVDAAANQQPPESEHQVGD